MKLTGKQIGALIIAIVVILAGGLTIHHFNANSDDQTEKSGNSQSTTSYKKATNEKNAKGLAKALKKENLKFKIATGDTWDEFGVVWTTQLMTEQNNDETTKQNEYGFNQATKGGTSIMAYASQQKLNNEQQEAMSDILNGDVQDDQGNDYQGISKIYPKSFLNGFPKEGTSFDYATVSNVKLKNAKMDEEQYKGFKQVIADVTLHITTSDGQKHTHVYHSDGVIPNAGNTPLDSDDVKEANHADIMNKPVPNKNVLGFGKGEGSDADSE